ncbi:MAG: CBS domain-containing protein [Candidatus Nitronauta litoralis]|uniref:CBS domain-containing protein n=1 Tax=Candidatus Nitronauta litoralis TaxID=2705533 RepID=A0A7T0FZY4_9BACT|nr:MAG: CBS domain-containing protein [Candidatus Nitronauta litoralis]
MAKVAEFMSHQVFSISPDQHAHKAVEEMYQNGISALIVKKDDEDVGIFTKTDWMVLVLKGECDPKELKVSSLMTDIKHTIGKDETIARACAIIEEKNVRHIPVKEGNKIVGMFSVKDLEKYYLSLHKKTEF